MWAIVKITVWQRRWSIFWWCLGIGLFVLLELSVYNSVKGQAAQLNQSLAGLPGSVKSLFGISTDLFSPVGYLNSRLFYLLLPLLLSILTIGLGSSLLAKEEADRTIELLLSRPLSRRKLLIAKLFSGFIILAIVAGVSTLFILGGVKLVGLAVPLPLVAFSALLAAAVALLFGVLAFTITCFGRRGRGAAIGVASLVGLGGYIVTSLQSNVSWLNWPAKALPYHYYNPTDVLNGHYDWGSLGLFGVIILLLILIASRSFSRRDING